MGKLFGTDGVRGVANMELTPLLAFHIGKAAAYVFSKQYINIPLKIIIGRDTRVSSTMLEAALSAGLCSVGVTVYSAGVITTPCVAYLTKYGRMQAGVMISASHNSFEDNGIKFFDESGYKLTEEIEDAIEDIIFNKLDVIPQPMAEHVGKIIQYKNATIPYVTHACSVVTESRLADLNITMDCANGASYILAPQVYRELGVIKFFTMNDNPNGTNINDNCGSTNMDRLAEAVVVNKSNLGIAYDGDGDRCLLVDETGSVVSGDEILSICAFYMNKEHRLKSHTVVTTIMSNMGLDKMAEKHGIKVIKTGVGDRYVLESMLKKGYNLGGEQSGHIIFLDHSSTGDGLITSLQIIDTMIKYGYKLSSLRNLVKIYPQVLLDAKVSNDKKYQYLDNLKINSRIKELNEKIGDKGRLLVRPSGTEPKIRVMLEGEKVSDINTMAKGLVKLIEKELI